MTDNLFAVFDPNWGEPTPIIETISSTKEAAIERVVWLRDHQLYSGAQLHGTPPRPGNWGRMQGHGYTVRPIRIVDLTADV